MTIFFDKINILLAVTACLNLLLGLIIFFNGPRKKINIVYNLNIVTIISWVLGMVLYRTAPQETSLFWCKVLYVAPTLIASSFLYFTYIFPSQQEKNILFKSLAIFSVNAIMITMVAWPNFIIKEVNIKVGLEKEIIFSKYYFFYFFYIANFFSYGFLRLFKRYKKSAGIERLQVLYLLSGYALSANLAFVTNLIMPWIGLFFLNWLGQIFTVIMVGFTAYAILKHHLMDIKVIAAEIFTLLISLILFINSIYAKSFNDFVLNFSIFLGVTFFGILLIRSVLKEVKAKEELGKLTAELQKAYEELKVLDKAKSEFISMASHQLRTPLSAIKGYISMLIDGSYGKMPPKAKEKMENVFESNERLIRIINDLLDISKIEMGKMELDKEPTQLEELLQSCYDEMKINAEKKKLKFVFEKPKPVLPKIELDILKFRQIILNLIDNAIRYTQKGEIEIGVEKIGSAVRIFIKDTGEGLVPEEQRNVFQGFTRGQAGIAHFVEGAGLGLYTAKKFLELHKGKIWVESEGRGKGSTFFVELPIR